MQYPSKLNIITYNISSPKISHEEFYFQKFSYPTKVQWKCYVVPRFQPAYTPDSYFEKGLGARKKRKGRGGHFLGVIYFETDDYFFSGGRRVDCNIESVTGRCSWSAVVKAVVDADRGWHICSHRAGPLRIITAAKDPLCCGVWSDQFIVDILTRKEYKAGISIR